jgi:TonB family protein
MLRPRNFVTLLLTATAILCASYSISPVPVAVVYAQQQDSQQLYKAAKSYYEAREYQKALDAIEELLKADSFYAPALLLKYKALVGLFTDEPPPPPPDRDSHNARLERRVRLAKLLNEAADSLEKYLQLKPDATDAEYLRGQLNALRVYAEPAIKPESEWTFFSPTDVTEKAHILHRQEPQYTEEARRAQVHGRVKLLALFADDGTVKDILVLQTLAHGLTEAAIKAARGTSFQPAIKDGRPVSTSIMLEYGFNLF